MVYDGCPDNFLLCINCDLLSVPIHVTHSKLWLAPEMSLEMSSPNLKRSLIEAAVIHLRHSCARPTNDISIEFEIRSEFVVLWLKMRSTDHNEISHMTRHCYCCDVCKTSLFSARYVVNKNIKKFHWISNSIEISLVGWVPDISSNYVRQQWKQLINDCQLHLSQNVSNTSKLINLSSFAEKGPFHPDSHYLKLICTAANDTCIFRPNRIRTLDILWSILYLPVITKGDDTISIGSNTKNNR